MPMLTIHHRTTYSFREDVSLLVHRLMLRPGEGRELKLLGHDISTSPEAELSWSTTYSETRSLRRRFGPTVTASWWTVWRPST
ncbi:hypothetical protein RvVAT039_pl05710 (plasmid) [Agrobacterium vitis]|nr:hypothetical protein RvVAR0630_pl04640 [Agrobacterium vitis]BCH67738.1 hypothetical protein RvVAT039_pl05710 [Agrobacterium vitis]